jgi:hypothetical protein
VGNAESCAELWMPTLESCSCHYSSVSAISCCCLTLVPQAVLLVRLGKTARCSCLMSLCSDALALWYPPGLLTLRLRLSVTNVRWSELARMPLQGTLNCQGSALAELNAADLWRACPRVMVALSDMQAWSGACVGR